MLNSEQLDAAKRLCYLLMWDNSNEAEKAYQAFLENIKHDEDHVDALRTALYPVIAHTDWNELDMMFDDLQAIAKAKNIPFTLNQDDEDLDFNSEDPFSDFFEPIDDMLSEHGYNLWSWETGCASFCTFIAKSDDYEGITEIAELLELTEDKQLATAASNKCSGEGPALSPKGGGKSAIIGVNNAPKSTSNL